MIGTSNFFIFFNFRFKLTWGIHKYYFIFEKNEVISLKLAQSTALVLKAAAFWSWSALRPWWCAFEREGAWHCMLPELGMAIRTCNCMRFTRADGCAGYNLCMRTKFCWGIFIIGPCLKTWPHVCSGPGPGELAYCANRRMTIFFEARCLDPLTNTGLHVVCAYASRACKNMRNAGF